MLIKKILKQIKNSEPILERYLFLSFISNEQMSLKEIAVKMGYSEESNHTIYKIKNKAIREFAIRYFGIDVQKST